MISPDVLAVDCKAAVAPMEPAPRERVLEDSDEKPCATKYLHTGPLLGEPLGEV